MSTETSDRDRRRDRAAELLLELVNYEKLIAALYGPMSERDVNSSRFSTATGPHTQVVFADEEGAEFAVSVFGGLSYEAAIQAGRRHLRRFIDLGAWEPTGEPTYQRMQEGS